MTPLKQKKGLLGLYVFLLIALFILLAFAQTCRNPRLSPIEKGGSEGDTLDVAIVYGPLSYYIYADTLGGINFDMLRAYERECSIPVKFWPIVDLNDSFDKLENGTFDLLASVPADYAIKQRFLTTTSVFLDRLVLIQLSDSAGNRLIHSALDLSGDTVYVAEGSPAYGRLENLSREIGDPIIIESLPEMSDEYLCIKVASGDIALAVVNEKTAKKMQETYPLLSYDNPVSFTQFQSWLLAKEDTVRFQSIEKWLGGFKETARYRKIVESY